MKKPNYFAVNICDMTNIEEIRLKIFKMTLADNLESTIIDAEKTRIDGKAALIKTSMPYLQQLATAIILSENWKLRVYTSINAKNWNKITPIKLIKLKTFMEA